MRVRRDAGGYRLRGARRAGRLGSSPGPPPRAHRRHVDQRPGRAGHRLRRPAGAAVRRDRGTHVRADPERERRRLRGVPSHPVGPAGGVVAPSVLRPPRGGGGPGLAGRGDVQPAPASGTGAVAGVPRRTPAARRGVRGIRRRGGDRGRHLCRRQLRGRPVRRRRRALSRGAGVAPGAERDPRRTHLLRSAPRLRPRRLSARHTPRGTAPADLWRDHRRDLRGLHRRRGRRDPGLQRAPLPDQRSAEAAPAGPSGLVPPRAVPQAARPLADYRRCPGAQDELERRQPPGRRLALSARLLGGAPAHRRAPPGLGAGAAALPPERRRRARGAAQPRPAVGSGRGRIHRQRQRAVRDVRAGGAAPGGPLPVHRARQHAGARPCARARPRGQHRRDRVGARLPRVPLGHRRRVQPRGEDPDDRADPAGAGALPLSVAAGDRQPARTGVLLGQPRGVGYRSG